MTDTFQIDSTDIDFSEVPDTTTDTVDGKRECGECGKRFTVTKSGEIRQHNCNGVRTVTRTKKSGKKVKSVPDVVMRVGTAALASGIEFGTRRTVANYVPCPPSVVPADLPDADAMLGPIIRFLWPNIPAKAQTIISGVCDHEDLLMCALAWSEYIGTMRKFAEAAHTAVQQQNAGNVSQLPVGGNANGIPRETNGSSIGTNIGAEPFKPANP